MSQIGKWMGNIDTLLMWSWDGWTYGRSPTSIWLTDYYGTSKTNPFPSNELDIDSLLEPYDTGGWIQVVGEQGYYGYVGWHDLGSGGIYTVEGHMEKTISLPITVNTVYLIFYKTYQVGGEPGYSQVYIDGNKVIEYQSPTYVWTIKSGSFTPTSNPVVRITRTSYESIVAYFATVCAAMFFANE